MKREDISRLIRRLETQIETAEKLSSNWIFLTTSDAELCLELAEAEDTIMEILNEQKERRNNNADNSKSKNAKRL